MNNINVWYTNLYMGSIACHLNGTVIMKIAFLLGLNLWHMVHWKTLLLWSCMNSEFCVCVSDSLKKKQCTKCCSPHVNNWKRYIGLICTNLVHDRVFWKLLHSLFGTKYGCVHANDRIHWNRPRSLSICTLCLYWSKGDITEVLHVCGLLSVMAGLH